MARRGVKVWGFSGVVSAEDVSEDLTKSIADAEIQGAVGNLSSAELPKPTTLDDNPLHQLPATSGKISYFCPSCCDTSAWGEPLGPSCGGDDAAKYWFVAMRWPYYNRCTGFYDSSAKSWWHNKKILVTNPDNGKQVVLAVKDWGPCDACFPNCPQSAQNRVIDVSKTALDALGAVTDDTVDIEFADQNAPLGAVTQTQSFNIGDRVRTTQQRWVRSNPYIDNNQIWLAPKESTGIIIDGPQSGSGYTWWKIRYDVGIEGWTADSGALERYAPQYTVAYTFQYPLTGTWSVSQDFGVWNSDWGGYHLAEDVPADAYTPVYASANGKVRFTSTSISGYGSVIIIEHRIPDNSYVCTLYGHLSRSRGLQVNVGDTVSKGQLIGYIGDSSENGGYSPHIHFGIRKGGYSTEDNYCGRWLYVGYSRSCTGCTHEQYRDMWYDPSDFIGAPAISLGEAVDNTALSWTTGGNANWFGQTSTYYYGGDAAQSGAISHNQETWIQTTVSGPGTLSFYWKVSSEENYDYLEFYIDGIERDRISGDVDWQQESYVISSGSHTLKWRYMKDGSVSSGSDCGWLDKIEFVPNRLPTLSNGYVDPTNGTTSTNFYYYVSYYDADGDSPSTRYVYIDGTAYNMSLYSGSASNGVYYYGPKNLTAGSYCNYQKRKIDVFKCLITLTIFQNGEKKLGGEK